MVMRMSLKNVLNVDGEYSFVVSVGKLRRVECMFDRL